MKTVTLYIVLFAASMIAAMLAGNTIVSASSAAWGDSNGLRVETTSFAMPCNWETITVYGYEIVSTDIHNLVDVERCVVHGEDMDVAYSVIDNNGLPYGLLVRLHGHNVFALVQEYDNFGYGTAASYYQLDFVANTNRLIFTSSRWPYSVEQPLVIDDMAAALSPLYHYGEDARNVLRYGLSTDTPIRKVLSEPLYATSNVKSYKTSQDGKFMIAYVDDQGIIKVDVETGLTTKLLILPYDSWSGNTRPTIHAISPDGRYAFIGPKGTILDTKNCGDSQPGRIHRTQPILQPCTTTDISNIIADKVGFSPYLWMARFASDSSIEAIVSNGTNSEDKRRIIIHAEAEGSLGGIDYLAMGDSYSSGEGDIEDGGFWYAAGTGHRDGCHVSLRSYPYLLKQKWDIAANDMRSIACSGARVEPDYYANSSGEYLGQRLDLKDKSDDERQVAREDALVNFTPGIIHQIDFVQKYKPKILTLTAGGNDVGFGDILGYCASPVAGTPALWINSLCAYASNPQVAANLRRTIDEMRPPTENLVRKIKAASPETKVYLIGYPQFVAQDGCSNQSPLLEPLERSMIRSSVTRLNNILKLVARDTDVYYVSIEDALEGGQICQGSHYMTGPLQIPDKVASGYIQEAYHPNAEGHKKIAQAIDDQITNGNLAYTIIDIPLEEHGQRVVKKAVTSGYAGVGSTQMVEMGPGIFHPDGTVEGVIFSDQVSLGSFKVNPDGSLKAQIKIPQSLEAGNHLLTLTGQGVDGDIVQVQQYITIYDDSPATQNASGAQSPNDASGLLDAATVHGNFEPAITANGGGILYNSRQADTIDWIRPSGAATIHRQSISSGLPYVSVVIVGVLIVIAIGIRGLVHVKKTRK